MAKRTISNVPYVIMSGLPGDMATQAARELAKAPDVFLANWALTGPDMPVEMQLEERNNPNYHWHDGHNAGSIRLFRPPEHKSLLCRRGEWDTKHESSEIKPSSTILVDFTTPSSVEENVKSVLEGDMIDGLVIGTTMRAETEQNIKKMLESQYSVTAVVAPNLGLPLVAMQAMLEYAAKTFPGVFQGYAGKIRESHQQPKKDVSGTARKWQAVIEQTGVNFPEPIESVRDPARQLELGVPEQYLKGHAYHWYWLQSPDGTVKIDIYTKVNGRSVYALGAVEAVRFLDFKIREKAGRKVGPQIYSAVDVLKRIKPQRPKAEA